MTGRIEKIYFAYFGCKIGDQGKLWALHFCCSECTNNFNLWFSRKKQSVGFAVPMIWREQIDHTDGYFCITEIEWYNEKTRKNN